ncbi:LytTR family DNA-binding domain-containing protein [Veronia pacifica]|uniref:HTH LytTR-type domain-containing protein n=1 Tax=Veronia pacifica TaxID=1080227 RepID=A0A1C3EEA9_9GAMM|nr:LytTR family DNA-binding domain-containing protein [Veronia pacifica]ODA31581.1 hypothetical protein A8L45_16375 [Veronia pacifica]
MEQFQYILQRFDPGVIWLDAKNNIVAMNNVALEVLECPDGKPLGQEIVKFHPPNIRDKVARLMDFSKCPISSPPPISMVITAINKLLLLKISKTVGRSGIYGTNVIFYDLTGIATELEKDKIKIRKYPVYKNKKMYLIDIDEILYFKAEGHYTMIHTAEDSFLCNLAIGEIEQKSPEGYFVKTHRSFLVNLEKVKHIEKLNRSLLLHFNTAKDFTAPVSKLHTVEVKRLLNVS